MPIEIRELVIKATVGSGENAENSGDNASNTEGGNGAASEALINICVEKVLEILKEKAER
jgi:hypothetical protein